MADQDYRLVLFPAVSHALMAEKILKKEGIAFKLIPVPKHISTDCGICLRFIPDMQDRVEKALTGRLERFQIFIPEP
jgi:hypothetical protein